MKTARIAAAAIPYLAAAGTAIVIALLIATMSLTSFERHWVVFLSGVLAAAVFALVSHRTSARWVLARRTAQLAAMRTKLAIETRLRTEAQASLARALLRNNSTASEQPAPTAPTAPAAPPAPAAPALRPAFDSASHATAARLIEALENDEFSLYSQAIVALDAAGGGASFCEVLLRMNEEEEKLLPPGSFLPVAEEHGLLPDVDRWVVRNVLNADAALGAGSDAVYFVNLAPPTVAEGGLAAFVRAQLDARKLDGKLLCFEFPESDVVAHPDAYRKLITALDGSGCRFAVSGFGRTAASVQFLKQLRVNYVKLDGEVALNIARGPKELARAQALIVAAHAAGMEVVAQCVESDVARALLRRLKADFVQGFGIAMPRPMGPARTLAPAQVLQAAA